MLALHMRMREAMTEAARDILLVALGLYALMRLIQARYEASGRASVVEDKIGRWHGGGR